jgi:hypothetical protein
MKYSLSSAGIRPTTYASCFSGCFQEVNVGVVLKDNLVATTQGYRSIRMGDVSGLRLWRLGLSTSSPDALLQMMEDL